MKKFIYTSDIHLPYDQTENVIAFLDAVKKEKPDIIVLGGDIIDFFKISRFDKDPLDGQSLTDEIAAAKAFFSDLRLAAGKRPIYWLEGNHEERLTKFIRRNAPEFADFNVLQMESLFDLERFDITYVRDTQVLQIEDWVFRHGHENGNGSTPGLSARKGVLMYGANYIQGHIHKANVIRVSNYNGDFIGVESPCLCDMEPEYVKGYAGWQAGWTIAEKDEVGKWQIKQKVL